MDALIGDYSTEFARLDGNKESWLSDTLKNRRLIRKVNVSGADSHKQNYFYQIASFPGLEIQGYWNKCPCNEMDAIQRRHFIPNLTPLYTEEATLMQSLFVKEWSNFENLLIDDGFDYQIVSHKVVMEHTRPSIKKRYEKAWFDIQQRRVIHNENTSALSAFVKFEKIPIGKIDDGKAPRLIQFRDYKYLYSFKRAFLPISLGVKSCDAMTEHGQRLNTVFTKNYPGHAIGDLIADAWGSFKDPVAVCLDHKCFDGHFMTQHMKVAHKTWNRLSKSKLLARLLKEQTITRIRTQCGIKVKASGKRASGEYTTSDENGITNYNMIKAVMKALHVKSCQIFVNGDDSIIIMERVDFNKIKMDQLLSEFAYLNMETSLDRIADSIEQISYCQSSPVNIGGKWTMVKTPFRAMSRLCYTDKLYPQDALRRYYGGLGLCELAVSAGVPMLQSFALWLISQSRGSRPIGGINKVVAKSINPGSLTVKEISLETRLSFEKAFGYSVEDQARVEGYFAGGIVKDTRLYIAKYKNFHLN